MKPEMTADRLGLTDLLEFSDLLLSADLFSFRVASWSMFPTLRKGDQLTIEAATPSQLRIGDLILFHRQGQLICHRLVALDETRPVPRLITKGDAVTKPDEPLGPDRVLGKVVHIRTTGWLMGPLRFALHHTAERLMRRIVRGLLSLQRHRAYRRLTGALLFRWFRFSAGFPEGSRWYRYQPIRRNQCPAIQPGHQRFHFIAKLGGTGVASLAVQATSDGFSVDHLHVRLPYRGLGLGSQLLTLACRCTTQSGGQRLLATIDAGNRPALGLFEQLGFQPLHSQGSSPAVVFVRDLVQGQEIDLKSSLNSE
jgi:signal peptidase I